MPKGYGLLIAKAREPRMTPAQLAKRIERTTSTVNRIEREETEPSAEQVNMLVNALPISTEELLIAMGVNLQTDEKAKAIWDSFYYDWIRLSQEGKEHVARLARLLVESARAEQPSAQTQSQPVRPPTRSAGAPD